MENCVLVTGGAGFIGSNFILHWMAGQNSHLANVDKLTYAGNPSNLASISRSSFYSFHQVDIANRDAVRALLRGCRPRAIVHFAAESHVDRSIRGPEDFILTNVNGTFNLLEESRLLWMEMNKPEKERFRFLHISTDEVYGSLDEGDEPFCEGHPYKPNSPYAASKAASDHLVRVYYRTYGLPTIITNCSNNYGPLQFPEKLIPLTILNGLQEKPLPVYGDGQNIRDWLYVEDHCDALVQVLEKGKSGETYNIGGAHEVRNIVVVRTICDLLDEIRPTGLSHHDLIRFVPDRPGHDRRYAINASKIANELGWRPRIDFSSGLRKTVQWYLQNQAWVKEIQNEEYRHWIGVQYSSKD